MKTEGAIARLSDRGFGFIAPDGSDKSIFFHGDQLVDAQFDQLFEGQRVSFSIEDLAKGPVARSIALALLEVVERKTFELSGFDRETHDPFAAIDDDVALCCLRANHDMLRHLQKHPESLHEIHPAIFEEIVGTIFEDEGFRVEKFHAWNQPDGGVDLFAVQKLDGLNPIRVAIQCKRYAPDRRISAAPIRSLAGVLDRFHAHAGVLATTCHFTTPATMEVRRDLWRIQLRDRESIVASLHALKLLRV